MASLPPSDDPDLVERLRAGDDRAFVELVRRYHSSMVAVAASFTPNLAVAEEAVQDAWIGVLRGIGRFEERSSLKTWIFRILVNRARTAGAREPRTVELRPTGDLVGDRFVAGAVAADASPLWTEDVESRLCAHEHVGRVFEAIEQLPPAQRQVVTLRDVEGLSSGAVCDMLHISEGNQRVLLHRGRARIRVALARRTASRQCAA